MQPAEVLAPDKAEVLSKAVGRAAKAFGLTQSELGKILGRDRSSIARGIDPDSKPGELALLLVRCYRALAVLMGQDAKSIKHWFSTPNHHTGGVPREQIQSVQGLVRVTEYLDAMRAKL
ncbi:MAG: MbcA/ParS/Xre antitoxin family protein [Arenicellales bacterium]